MRCMCFCNRVAVAVACKTDVKDRRICANSKSSLLSFQTHCFRTLEFAHCNQIFEINICIAKRVSIIFMLLYRTETGRLKKLCMLTHSAFPVILVYKMATIRSPLQVTSLNLKPNFASGQNPCIALIELYTDSICPIFRYAKPVSLVSPCI